MTTTVKATEVAQVSEVNHLLDLDNTPWYRKRNLRSLYLTLVPAALGVEMTSGYDGSILNGLQAVQPWLDCRQSPCRHDRYASADQHRLQQPDWRITRGHHRCFLDWCSRSTSIRAVC